MINKLLDKFNKIGCYNSLLKIHHQQVGGYLCTFTSFLRFFVQLYSACTAATIYIYFNSFNNFCFLCVVYTYETAKRVGKLKKMSIPFLSLSRKSIKINCRAIKTCFNPGDTGQHHQKNRLGRFKIIIKDVV